VYTERLALDRISASDYESEGIEHIIEANANGTGGVMVMSHFGRWELGARLLARDHHELTLVMGGAAEASPNRVVSADLQSDGVEVVSVARNQAMGTDVLDAAQAVRHGGIVALAGDRAWGNPRMMRLPFLGQAVDVPMAPFVLALVTGAPLLIVFACRTGRRRYRFECLPPIHIKAPSRAQRDTVLREAGMVYLEELRRMARAHPEQWHTFGPFLVERTTPPL
jgi:KDO2-lipid IV(A) lauroyltransferase